MKITANGIAVNYTLEGPPAGPVVTLSHSLAANLAMWEPQVSVLRDRYRVLRYDTRGHGGTEAPPGAYSIEMLAEDALALLGALGIERTHFVGLSMGGMIGQALALKAPERLASLALCDTTSRIPPEARATWDERVRTVTAEGMAPLVEATVARWFTAPFRARRPEVVDTVRAMIRSTPPAGYVGCCQAIAALDLTNRGSARSRCPRSSSSARRIRAPPSPPRARSSRASRARRWSSFPRRRTWPTSSNRNHSTRRS